jgi:hypothetical protein
MMLEMVHDRATTGMTRVVSEACGKQVEKLPYYYFSWGVSFRKQRQTRDASSEDKTTEVLHRVKEGRNIIHTIKRRKVNWIGHILLGNCLLKHVVEGKIEGRIEVTGRRGRSKQLLDNLKERKRYSKLKEIALDRTPWRTGFGKGCGPVVR